MAKKTIRFSTGADDPIVRDVIKRGVEVEKLGFNVFWVTDHLTDIPPATSVVDAWTVLAYIGAKTKRIALAPGVTDTQRIHPAKTASMVVTLDNLTSGRAILGIGAGELMNTLPFGMPWERTQDRIQRLMEYLEVVKSLWSSSFKEPVSYSGKFYKMKDAHLSLHAIQKPSPPIYVGAYSSSSMLRIVGEIADGWYAASLYTPDAFKERISIIKDSAERTGREFSKLDMVVSIPVVFSEDPKTRKIVKHKLKRSLVTSRYKLSLLGAEEVYDKVAKHLQYQWVEPTHAGVARLEKFVKNINLSDEVLERGVEEMMAVGSTDRCIETFAKFVTAGATHISIIPFFNDTVTLRRIAHEVIPHFR